MAWIWGFVYDYNSNCDNKYPKYFVLLNEIILNELWLVIRSHWYKLSTFVNQTSAFVIHHYFFIFDKNIFSKKKLKEWTLSYDLW